jgi:uncharacterized protein involved in exopolysaccharide biosynthesis
MADDYSVSLYRFAAAALRRWRITMLLPLGLAVATFLGSFVLHVRYASLTTFLPETQSSRLQLSSGLAGLAAQFGVPLGPAASQSPLLYVEIVQSERLLATVLQTKFANPDRARFGPADSLFLLDLLDLPRQRTSERALDAAVRYLRQDAIGIDVDLKTNLVKLSVEVEYPALAQQVTNQILALVNEFNRGIRRSQARARREFAEGRAREYQQSLSDAENALEQFYARNRTYRGSPELMAEEARLQRQVSIQQDLYLNMRRETETARLEEANTAPVLTVVDPPVIPVRKSFPKRGLLALFGLLAGLTIGVIRVLIDPALRARSADPGADAEALASAWRDARDEVRAALRLRRRRAA